ncbi:MAG: hypothetical protein HOV87_33310 [Catenulispora sp.]|nr:hypothetical protein [Catenulispora sp.]
MSDDLSRAMRATADNLSPNIGKLTAGGVERGVRKRRMRRISQITGGAASVTAVFAVVAAVGTGGSGSGAASAAGSPGGGTVPAAVGTTTTAPAAPSGTATAPSSAPSSSALPTKHRTAVPPPSAPSAPPVSGEDIAKLLEHAVAPIHFSSESVLNKAGTDDGGGPFAVLKVGYAAGIGNVAVDISNQAWDNIGWGDSLPPYTTIRTQPDGSHVVVYNGLQWPAGNGDPNSKRLDATWYRNDGVAINIEGINEAREKLGATATAVPLTVDQAVQIATSPIWDKAVAAKAYQGYLDYQDAMAGKVSTKTPGGDAAKPAQSSSR